MVQKTINNKRISKINKKINQKRSKKSKYLMAGGGFTISIKTLTGKVFELTDIYANTTTVMIKNKIYDSEGIPEDQQRLFYNGRQLADPYPIAVYGITPGSQLNLLLRLRGAMFQETSGRKPIVVRSRPFQPSDTQIPIDELIKTSEEMGLHIFSMGVDFKKVFQALMETDNNETAAFLKITDSEGLPIND